MNKINLELLGFSQNESKVYLSLIELGQASASEISKNVDIHRVNIYDSLERLEQKGFVSTIVESNKKYFKASSPEQLNNLIKEKEEEVRQIKESIPSLIEKHKNIKTQQDVSVHKGVKAVKNVLDQILKSKPLEILKFIEKKFDNFISTLIWDNNVAIFVWVEEPIVTLITNHQVSRGYVNYFYSLWEL